MYNLYKTYFKNVTQRHIWQRIWQNVIFFIKYIFLVILKSTKLGKYSLAKSYF